MSVDSNTGLLWCSFLPLCDWFRKTRAANLVIRVFSRFKQVACFYFEFSLVSDDLTFVLIGSCDYFGFSFGHSMKIALFRTDLQSLAILTNFHRFPVSLEFVNFG